MIKNLFVYGTLIPGGPNEHILKNIGGSFEEASICGTLHNEGWGADKGYPGIRLDLNGDKIQGYLFHSDTLDSQWEELDEFEGEQYERVTANVRLINNTTARAFVYVLKKNTH